MSNLSGRLGTLTIVILSIIFACIAGGAYYYFQVKSNENYQNQLYLRELSNVASTIDKGVAKFRQIGQEFSNQVSIERQNVTIKSVRKPQDEIVELTVKASSLQQKRAKLEKQKKVFVEASKTGGLETLIDKIDRKYDETLKSERKLIGLNEERLELETYFDNQKRQSKLDEVSYSVEFRQWLASACDPSQPITAVNKAYCGLINGYLASAEEVSTQMSAPTKDTFLKSLDEKVLFGELKDVDDLLLGINNNLVEKRTEFANKLRNEELLEHYNQDCAKLSSKPKLSEIESDCKKFNSALTAYNDEQKKRQSLSKEVEQAENALSKAKSGSAANTVIDPLVKDLAAKKKELKDNTAVFEQKTNALLEQFEPLQKRVEFYQDKHNFIRELVGKSRTVDGDHIYRVTRYPDVLSELIAAKTSTESLQVKLVELSDQYDKKIKSEEELGEIEQQIKLIDQDIAKVVEKRGQVAVRVKFGSNQLSRKAVGPFVKLVSCYENTLSDCKEEYIQLRHLIRGDADSKGNLFDLSRGSDLLRFFGFVNLSEKHLPWKSTFSPYLNVDNTNVYLVDKPSGLRLFNYKESNDKWLLQPLDRIEGELLAAPFEQLIDASISHFPVVTVVDEQGKQLARSDNILKGVETKGIELLDLAGILKQLYSQQKQSQSAKPTHTLPSDNGKSPGISGFVDVSIAGISYRVFISPYHAQISESPKLDPIERPTKSVAKSQQLYIVGIIAKKHLYSSIFGLSGKVLMVITAALLILLCLLSVLKVRLVNANRAFSQRERHLISVGLIGFVTIFASFFTCWLIYQQGDDEFKQQHKRITNQIISAFDNEYQKIIGLVEEHEQQLIALKQKPKDSSSEFKNAVFKSTEKTSDAPYFVESMFHISETGKVENAALWSTKLLFLNKGIDISKREYFKQAQSCRYRSKVDCDKPYIQRLFNLRDGRTTTQFAQYLNKDNGDRSVLSYGAKIQSFFHPVLPQDFGFLVFDNDSGDVLYHSDTKRSLIENVFAATDNDFELRTIKDEVSLIRSELDQQREPVIISVQYNGEPHRFALKSLDQANWTLAVFYKKENLQLTMYITFVLSLAFLIPVILLVFVLLRTGLVKSKSIRYIFWYDGRFVNDYKQYSWILGYFFIFATLMTLALAQYWLWLILLYLTIAIVVLYLLIDKGKKNEILMQRNRVLKPPILAPAVFSRFIVLMLVFFFAVPSALLTHVATDFMLQKYTEVELSHLQQQQNESIAKRRQYFWLLNSDIDKPTNDPQSVEAKIQQAPRYLGCIRKDNKTCSEHEGIWFINNEIPSKQIEGPINRLLAGALNYFTSDNLFLNKIESANEVKDKTSIVYEHSIFWKKTLLEQWYWIFYVMLFTGFLYWLIRDLICIRLMGLDVVDNFRIDDSKATGREEKLKILKKFIGQSRDKQPKFIQIIRPSDKLVDLILAQRDELNISTEIPVRIDELVELIREDKMFDDIEHLCKFHFKLNDGLSQQTIVIKGLELVALDECYRVKALNVLEHLMALRYVNIVLLSEVAPLYRLSRQSAYPVEKQSNAHADAFEITRWAELMKNFSKLYDWTPKSKSKLISGAKAYNVYKHEKRSWPELYQIADEFISYHSCFKDLSVGDTENALGKSIDKNWQPQQVIDYFSANAGALYRYRWELCTKNERLLLYQMALGGTPNPSDPQSLEHLMRRGYIFRDNGWHIVNESFHQFILTAEDPAVMTKWLEETTDSPWRFWQIPILTMFLLILGILAYSATEHLNSALAVFTAILSLLPVLFKGASVIQPNNTNLPSDE